MERLDDYDLRFWYDKYSFSEEIESRLFRYYQLIHEYNKVMNLTGIDDVEGVYLKHFYDSLTVLDQIEVEDNIRIADVGTGAGFPGLVLAICCPNINVTLIEPLQKRCKFLDIVVKDLNLLNVTIINKRSEDINEKYDYVVSRAVARLNILLELCSQLVTDGGFFIALKGRDGALEIKEATKAMQVLGFKLDDALELQLPVEESNRVNIKLYKFGNTPVKYPRNFGQIKNKPL